MGELPVLGLLLLIIVHPALYNPTEALSVLVHSVYNTVPPFNPASRTFGTNIKIQDQISVSSESSNGFEHHRVLSSFPDIYPMKSGKDQKRWKYAVVAIGVVVLVLVPFLVWLCRRKRISREQEDDMWMKFSSQHDVELGPDGNFKFKSMLMHLSTLRHATDNFSEANTLGRGGFGTVYKGKLPDGTEIAVKRLSKQTSQGLEQFKKEVVLIAGLQHRNLVKLLGCAMERDEKLLVYEYMPNRSLDNFIFRSEQRVGLNWNACHKIIIGIARGLIYLHEESQVKVIHRDLKPSNILLDETMVAKISDFGIARVFDQNQTTKNTKKIAGTCGYMAPEYVLVGDHSEKSDVYSFGVVVLEIISGHRNYQFHKTGKAQTLIAFAWKLWSEGRKEEFIEPLLIETDNLSEILKAMQVGLLCVQADADDRPTMLSVVSLLGSDMSVGPQPKQPAFLGVRLSHESVSSSGIMSVSDVSNDWPR